MTMRLLANMAQTARMALSIPDMARGDAQDIVKKREEQVTFQKKRARHHLFTGRFSDRPEI
jgi:hypothetical protein